MSSSSKPKSSKSTSSTTTSSKTSPGKPQTAKTETPATQSKSHEARKEHGHGHSHGGGGVGVGVSVNIPLERIGQRPVEDDPFAVSSGPPPPRTQEKLEKPKTREKQHEITTPSAFANISVTGPEAKEESEPPGPINVSDELTPSQPTTAGGVATPTIDDLKKAQKAYGEARDKFLQSNPDYPKLMSDFAQTPENKKKGNPDQSKKAHKKLVQLADQFKQSDEGKKLFDDWMKVYQALNKPGTDIPDDLVPPDKLEKAKHNLAKAQSALNSERDTYDDWKNHTVSNHDGVKKIQVDIDELKKKPHYSDKDLQEDKEKLKKLEADLDNAKKAVAKEWAESEQAKNQMKKVQQAEKELDKAKEAYKPFEQLEQKPAKAASNP